MKIELTEKSQWVCYTIIEKENKKTKIPISPISGKGASSTNPSDWSDYVTACNYKVKNNLQGIGFVLTESDPYTCIDLDDCIENGEIKEYAKEIIDKFNTYTEISQSGRGVHIFLKGTKPGNKSRKNTGEPIEIYDRKRYIAITGKALKKSPINDCQKELVEIYNQYFGNNNEDIITYDPFAMEETIGNTTFVKVEETVSDAPNLISQSVGDAPNLIPPTVGDAPNLIPPCRGATRKSESFFRGGVENENVDIFQNSVGDTTHPFPPTTLGGTKGGEIFAEQKSFLLKNSGENLVTLPNPPLRSREGVSGEQISTGKVGDAPNLIPPCRGATRKSESFFRGGVENETNITPPDPFNVEETEEYVPSEMEKRLNEILNKFSKSDKRQKLLYLFDGRFKELGYPSQSEADGAFMYYLAYFTGCDSELMDYIFRHSGLYRQKYEREDYRNSLISNAIRDMKKPNKPVNKSDWVVPDLLEDYSEVALCDYLYNLYGKNMKFNINQGKWMIWKGKLFSLDEEGISVKYLIDALNDLKEKITDSDISDKIKEKAIKYIISAKTNNKLKSILEILKSKKGVSVNIEMLDTHKDLINCQNGVINLRTGELLPHDRKYLMTKIINVSYSEYKIIEDLKDSKFYKFMNEITKENSELIDYHQRNIGYFLTGETREQSFYIYYGKGSTGKSTLTNLIKNIMGDYCKIAPTGTFTETCNQKYFELASVSDGRLVLSSENSDKYRMDERLIKQISGGDTVSCCFKGQDFFQYTPKYKVLITTNEINTMRSQGYDMKRRLKVIPFKQRFGGDSKEAKPLNDNLNEELMEEAEYILPWMVRGAVKYYNEGIKVPDVVKEEINEVMTDQDPLSAWEQEYYERDENSFVPVAELWDSFSTYCQNLNSANPFKTICGFSRNLAKRDYLRKGRNVDGVIFYGLSNKIKM